MGDVAKAVLRHMGHGGSGQTEVGNIDAARRPVVKNKDGSVSTVRSRRFGFDGEEVLLPTVSDDGRIMDDAETVATYRATGKHLGKFTSGAAADDYAENLHLDQARRYGK